MEGRIIVQGSAVDSTYWVSALGAGATSKSRFGRENCNCDELELEPLSSSSDGFLLCRKSLMFDVGRLWLIAASSCLTVLMSLTSSSNSPSTPFDISSRCDIHVPWTPLFNLIRVERFIARTSRERSGPVSGESNAERLDWVEIEDCMRAFDISRACTLRSSSASRNGSASGTGTGWRLRLRV